MAQIKVITKTIQINTNVSNHGIPEENNTFLLTQLAALSDQGRSDVAEWSCSRAKAGGMGP